jgi:hypothetical protein
VVLDGTQSTAELGRGLGLSGSEERGEDAVVDLGVEDGEGRAVGSQVASTSQRSAGSISGASRRSLVLYSLWPAAAGTGAR